MKQPVETFNSEPPHQIRLFARDSSPPKTAFCKGALFRQEFYVILLFLAARKST